MGNYEKFSHHRLFRCHVRGHIRGRVLLRDSRGVVEHYNGQSAERFDADHDYAIKIDIDKTRVGGDEHRDSGGLFRSLRNVVDATGCRTYCFPHDANIVKKWSECFEIIPK